MEAATGATVVAGALFILAVGFIWIWGIVAGPAPVRWLLITMVLLTALVLIGRWFDRRERRVPAPPFDHAPYLQLSTGSPTVQEITQLRRNRDPNACGSIRPLWGTPGALLECELTKTHVLEPTLHQASRPNGRYLWGNGDNDDTGSPRWEPDDHWEGDDRLPPKEPFSWKDHRQATWQSAQIERTDPREPQS
jgi:hypothetical protein